MKQLALRDRGNTTCLKPRLEMVAQGPVHIDLPGMNNTTPLCPNCGHFRYRQRSCTAKVTFDPSVMFVALALDYPLDLFSGVIVAVLNVNLETLNQKFFVFLGGVGFDLAKFVDTYLELRKNHFESPLRRMREFESSADTRETLLLDLMILAGILLDNIALEPVEEVPSIHPCLNL